MPKRVIAFDLDDTLTVSKSPVDPIMASLLCRLLVTHRVCVISGAAFPQFRVQLIDRLGPPTVLFDRLHVMPTSGTAYYVHSGHGEWREVYREEIAEEDKRRIMETLVAGAQRLGLWEARPTGEIIEDRGCQVTFSALGQQATAAAKRSWDPDGSRREALRAYAAPRLPGFEVRSGGSTSIDVTPEGVDKGYGMARLLEHLDVSKADVLYVGDRLDEGGNDYPVKAMGIETVAVGSWHDTAQLVRLLLRGDDSPPATT